MPKLTDERKRAATLLETAHNQAKTFRAELDAKGADKVTGEDRTKLNAMIEAATEARKSLVAIDQMDENEAAINGGGEGPRVPQGAPHNGKSIGRRFASLPAIAEKRERTAGRAEVSMEVPVDVKATLVGAGGTTNQVPVQPDRMPDILALPRLAITVLDLLDVGATNSNMVEWVRHVTRTLNPAETQEAAAKPQSDLTFDLVQSAVRTIPHYVTVTRQILADEPRLRSTIDDELMFGLRNKLAAQVITGPGTGVTLLGILNTPGIGARVKSATVPSGRAQTTTTSLLDTIRYALTDIELAGFAPDAVLVNPVQAEAFEIEKDSTGRYLVVFDPVGQRLWRRPVVSDTRCTAGTAVVGAFRQGARLWMREEINIMTGQPNDHFRLNLLDILAEMRAAFAVQYATAFQKITGL